MIVRSIESFGLILVDELIQLIRLSNFSLSLLYRGDVVFAHYILSKLLISHLQSILGSRHISRQFQHYMLSQIVDILIEIATMQEIDIQALDCIIGIESVHTLDRIDVALDDIGNATLLSNKERMYSRFILMIIHDNSPDLTVDFLFLQIRPSMHNTSKVVFSSDVIIDVANSLETVIRKCIDYRSIGFSLDLLLLIAINNEMLLLRNLFRRVFLISITSNTSLFLSSKLFISQRRSNVLTLLLGIHELFMLLLSKGMNSLRDALHLFINCLLQVGHILSLSISHFLLLLRESLRIKGNKAALLSSLIKLCLYVVNYSQRSRIRYIISRLGVSHYSLLRIT